MSDNTTAFYNNTYMLEKRSRVHYIGLRDIRHSKWAAIEIKHKTSKPKDDYNYQLLYKNTFSESCFDKLYNIINKHITDNNLSMPYTLDELEEISKHKHIKLENRDEVFEFINRTPDKVSEYLKAIYKINSLVDKYFDEDAKYFLKINEDPDVFDEYLKFIIREKNYSMDTMKKIRELRKEFRKFFKPKNIDVFITTDFKPIG